MKSYKETKKPEEMNVLKGIEIVSIEKDSSDYLVAIVFQDVEGNRMKVKKDSSYNSNIVAVVPEMPKKVTHYLLKGTLMSETIPFSLEFEVKEKAEEKKRILMEKDDSAIMEIEEIQSYPKQKEIEVIKVEDGLPF